MTHTQRTKMSTFEAFHLFRIEKLCTELANATPCNNNRFCMYLGLASGG